jgi:hypothetical protein
MVANCAKIQNGTLFLIFSTPLREPKGKKEGEQPMEKAARDGKWNKIQDRQEKGSWIERCGRKSSKKREKERKHKQTKRRRGESMGEEHTEACRNTSSSRELERIVSVCFVYRDKKRDNC